MAHLNLRDRTVELTIAYIGDAGAHNLQRVQAESQRGRPGAVVERDVDGRRVLALEWRPRDAKALNDCALAITLLASGASPEAGALDAALPDADAFVLALDADPSAAERNARAAESVRNAVARAGDRRLPVVVQLNGDDDRALEAQAYVRDGWPRVNACAAKGEGVMETLQRAVEAMVDSMQTAKGAAPRTSTARGDGNPLLTALRAMIQSSFAEHLDTLESRIAERFREKAALEHETTRSLEAHLTLIEQQATTLHDRVDAVDERLAALESLVRESVVDAERAQQSATAEVTRRMQSLEALVREDDGRAQVERLDSRLSAAAHALLTEVRESRKGLRDELARIGVATAGLQRTIDASAADVRKLAASPIEAAVTPLHAKADAVASSLDALVEETRAARERFDTAVSKVLQGDVHVGRRIVEVRDAMKLLGEELSTRTDAVRGEVTELTEELRKKKKTWFG